MEVIYINLISYWQQKGVVLGIVWSLFSWVPFYTNFLNSLRYILGVPAILGINLEIALNHGDAFIYSILLGAGLGFTFGSIIDKLKNGIKIIGITQSKKQLVRKEL